LDASLVFGTSAAVARRGGAAYAASTGACSGLHGEGNVYYFEVIIGSSAPLEEHVAAVGAFEGADVYVGFAETSLAGLPGIEDYRSIALSGKSGKVCCNESDLPLFGATAALDTALCNAQAAPFEEVEPMRFAAGDVVGCGIDLRVHRAFFTKNGDFGGWAGDLWGERGESWGPTGPDGQWILPPDDNIKMFPVVAFKNKEDVISINIAAEGFPLRPLAFNTDELPPLPSEPPTPAHTSRPGSAAGGAAEAGGDGCMISDDQWAASYDAMTPLLQTDRSIATLIGDLELADVDTPELVHGPATPGSVQADDATHTYTSTLSSEALTSSSSERIVYDRGHSGITAAEDVSPASSGNGMSLLTEADDDDDMCNVASLGPSRRPDSLLDRPGPPAGCSSHSSREAALGAPLAVPLQGGGWGGVWKESDGAGVVEGGAGRGRQRPVSAATSVRANGSMARCLTPGAASLPCSLLSLAVLAC